VSYPASDMFGFRGSSTQVSSVILDQKDHRHTTAKRLNNVSNSDPSIFPFAALHKCTLMTKLKTWPMAKRRTAPDSRIIGLVSPRTRNTRMLSRTK